MTENFNEFLKELTELSNKRKIYIGGCGCCGSPYLFSGDETEGEYDVDEENDNLGWTHTLKTVNEIVVSVEAFIEALEDPKEPSEELKKAVATYQQRNLKETK